MDDRFKFRAWHEGFIDKNIEPQMLFDEIEGDCLTFKRNQPVTLMQCTGLKDKNGKLIFEGDVVRIIYRFDGSLFDGHYQVNISHSGVSFCFKQLSWEDGAKNQLPLFNRLEGDMILSHLNGRHATSIQKYHDGNRFFTEDIEIIGNIHENPELLRTK